MLSEPFVDVGMPCKLFLPKTLRHEVVNDEARREVAAKEAANYQDAHEDRKQCCSHQAGGSSCGRLCAGCTSQSYFFFFSPLILCTLKLWDCRVLCRLFFCKLREVDVLFSLFSRKLFEMDGRFKVFSPKLLSAVSYGCANIVAAKRRNMVS